MMDDVISRQDVIDTIMEEPSEMRYPVYYAEKIKQLTSAQHDIVKVVRCKDCKWHDFGKPDMVYCQNLDFFVSEDFFCKDGERGI